jgi:hypothetical protein
VRDESPTTGEAGGCTFGAADDLARHIEQEGYARCSACATGAS